MVASCSSGGGESNSAAPSLEETKLVQNNLSFDNVGQIPLQGANKEFMVRLHNTYSNQFSLKSIEVIDPLTNKVMKNLAGVKSAMCAIVPANNSCSINVTPHLQNSGSFILQAKLADNEGKIFTVRQLVRLSDKVSSSNGILFDNDLASVSAPEGFYHMSFPVVLDEHFDDLKATNGRVICEGGFNKGSNCTYFVDGKSLADNTLVETKLEGYRAGNLVARSSYTTRVTSASLANLLISQPADINIGESQNSGSSVVTLFNNGNLEASSVLPFATGNNLSVTSSDCTTILVPGASCNFTVQAQSEVNGTGSVGANYSSGNTKSDVGTNIVYSKANVPGKLELSNVGGSLSNSFVGIPANEFLVISNSGSRKLTAIRYGIDQGQEFKLSGAASGSIAGCAASGSLELAPSQKCALKVVYTPKAATSTAMNYKLSVVGNYTNSNNLEGSVVSDLTRPYSALAMANVLSLSADVLNMIVQTNKTDSRELTVTNTSPFDVTLGTLALTSAVDGLGITTGSTCLADNQLLKSGGGNCVIKVTYSPTSDITTDTKLSIPVAKIGATTAPANMTREVDVSVRGVATLAPAAIKVDISAPSTLPSGVSSNGVANSYKVLGLPGTSFELTYTFSAESGKGDATLFNVSSAGLPVGAEIIIGSGTTCPVGAKVGALNAGESCIVVVAGPRKSLVENGLLMAGQLGIKLLYSWQDVSAAGKIQVQKEETEVHNINITTDWLDDLRIFPIGKFTESVTANGTVSTVTVRTVFSGLLPNTSVQYPLTVSASIPGNLSKITCVINNEASTECSNTLDIPTTAPAGDYYVDVEISDNTQAPNTRIYRRSVKVTNPNPVVNLSGKAFPISETINLTKALADSSAEASTSNIYDPVKPTNYIGFILAAWSEANAVKPLTPLLVWGWTQGDVWETAPSQINVYVTNINNGNIGNLLVKGLRIVPPCVPSDYSLNTFALCATQVLDSDNDTLPAGRYKYWISAKLQVLDSDNDTLPAGRYKGNFELIAKGWQIPTIEKRIKVNVDFEKK